MLAQRKRVSRSPSQSRSPETAKRRREGRDESGVHLLPGVEAPLRPRFPAKPETVVVVEQIELAERPAQTAAVSDHDDDREQGDPRDRGVDVEVLDRVGAARRAALRRGTYSTSPVPRRRKKALAWIQCTARSVREKRLT